VLLPHGILVGGNWQLLGWVITAEGAPHEFVSVAAAPHKPTSSADVAVL